MTNFKWVGTQEVVQLSKALENIDAATTLLKEASRILKHCVIEPECWMYLPHLLHAHREWVRGYLHRGVARLQGIEEKAHGQANG